MNASTAVAAPFEIELEDGTKYKLSGLRIRDHGAFERIVQQRAAAALGAENGSAITPEQLASVMGITYYSDTSIAYMGTTEGMARICWLSARRNHPDLEFEAFFDKLQTQKNLLAMNAAFWNLQTLEREAQKKSVPSSGAATASSTSDQSSAGQPNASAGESKE